jgi:cell division protein FtsL
MTASSASPRRSRRQAHLTVARVEPWSVMKFSFVVSVVAFVVLFVAVAVLYATLSALGVFDSLQHLVSTVTSSKSSAGTSIKSWFSASRILGYTGLLGSLNIVLITAMSTIGAVVYNLISKLFGGIEITLRESD